MTIYAVAHNAEGSYIGHGLYETETVVDELHATEASAKAAAEQRGQEYFVIEQEVKE